MSDPVIIGIAVQIHLQTSPLAVADVVGEEVAYATEMTAAGAGAPDFREDADT